MLKKRWKDIVVFAAIFIFVLTCNVTYTQIENDNIWNFHMIQKITLGYIPYKEINMIITPLFHFIGALFMKILGTNFFTFNIYGAVILAILGTTFYQFLKKVTTNKALRWLGMSFVIWGFSTVFLPNYNTFVVLFPLLLLFLEWKREEWIKKEQPEKIKKIDIGIGIVMAFGILTKQTIGGVFSIVYLIYLLIHDKIKLQKINWQAIGYKILGACLIGILFLIYLLMTGSLLDFFDLCFGGILDFAQKNRTGSFFTWETSVILGISFFCFLYFKIKKEDTKILLLGLFSITSLFFIYPLINTYHLVTSLMLPSVTLIYILDLILNQIEKEASKKIFNRVSGCIGVVIIGYILILWCNRCYTFESIKVPEDLLQYQGLMAKEEEFEKIKKVMQYIQEKEKEGYQVYVMSADAAKYMIPLERNNNKFDLMLQGNLGYKGEERLIAEIKEIENPLFLKQEELTYQESETIDKFIKENYQIIDKIDTMIVYAKGE